MEKKLIRIESVDASNKVCVMHFDNGYLESYAEFPSAKLALEYVLRHFSTARITANIQAAKL